MSERDDLRQDITVRDGSTPSPNGHVRLEGQTADDPSHGHSPAYEASRPDNPPHTATLAFSKQREKAEGIAAPTSVQPNKQRPRRQTQGVLKPRQILGARFEIVRPLGRGHMGAVYLARDKVLSRSVAIKTLRTDHLAPAEQHHWLQIFRREATSTARLQHPNITTLHDFGVDQGVPFMVLEYLRGTTLSVVTTQGVLSLEQIIFFATQLASALAHAHDQGVVHRDLKPTNLFVLPDQQLKVMDFGVSLLREHLSSTAPKNTHSPLISPTDVGTSQGIAETPLYMAPEQYVGGRQDERTDLWSLGVVLFELLTGRLPFADPDMMLANDAPSLDTWDVPHALAQLVRDCLTRDVEHRLPHAREALDILVELAPATVTHQPEHKGSPRSTNVSLPPDEFIGRHRELDALSTLIDQGARLITLLGPGGCGKTRLVQEFGLRVKHRFDATFFFDLTETQGREDIATVVGQTLDVPLTHTDPIEQLGHAIANRGHILLILDNFEHVVDHAATTIGVWLELTHQAVIIVTSRHRLELRHEKKFALDPLPLPDTNTWDRVQENPAVQLFVSRARTHNPHFVLSHDNAHAISTLVHSLDGLPLAIELAAARIQVLTPSQMLKQMHRRFALLRSKRRDLSHRQATLTGTLAWSWALLETYEQSALAQASVFEGGFTLDAAEAVINLDRYDDAPFVIDVIESLVDKSLIRTWIPHVGDQPLNEPRFGLLVSVQAYAAQKLDAAPPPPCDINTPTTSTHSLTRATERRHGKHYAQLGSHSALTALDRPGGTQQRRALMLEFDNLLVAQRRALKSQQPTILASVATALSELYLMRGPFATGVEHLTSICNTAILAPLERAHILVRRARLRTSAGQLDEARTDFLAAEDLCRNIDHDHPSILDEISAGLIDLSLRQGDAQHAQLQLDAWATRHPHPEADARSSFMRGLLHRDRGNLDQALTCFHEAHAQYQALGDPHHAATTQAEIGLILRRKGQDQAAGQHLRDARKRFARLGLGLQEANIMSAQGNLCVDQGNFEAADRHYRDALVRFERMGARLEAAQVRFTMSYLQSAQGHYADAVRAIEAVQPDFIELGAQSVLLESYTALGLLFREMGRLDAAAAALNLGLEIALSSENPSRLGQLFNALGEVARDRGDFGQALDHYRAYIDLATTTGEPLHIALGESNCGLVEMQRGDHIAAEDAFSRAVHHLRNSQHRPFLSPILACLAHAQALNGRFSEARESLAESLAHHDACPMPIPEFLRAIEGCAIELLTHDPVQARQALRIALAHHTDQGNEAQIKRLEALLESL